MTTTLMLCVGYLFITQPLQAENNAPIDPLDSPQWNVMHKRYLNNEPIVFDDKITILAPKSAEDSLNVPVSFKIKHLSDIKEIVVLADLNPLPMVLKFRPLTAKANLSFRLKLQQASPIRVAAKVTSGTWHVGSIWVNAAGGGCTAPSLGTSSGDWSSTLGQVSAKVWKKKDNSSRLRLKIMHPMDTGLASGIPRFHIENLTIRDQNDQSKIAELDLFEPISENPMLSLDVNGHKQMVVSGRDNNGNKIEALLKR